jgi:hypothetical protein
MHTNCCWGETDLRRIWKWKENKLHRFLSRSFLFMMWRAIQNATENFSVIVWMNYCHEFDSAGAVFDESYFVKYYWVQHQKIKEWSNETWLSQGMECAGHLARTGEMRNAYRILLGKSEEERLLGRPRRRCKDDRVM